LVLVNTLKGQYKLYIAIAIVQLNFHGELLVFSIPATPFLFLTCMQTLALYMTRFQAINTMDKEFKCCQLADDTAIFNWDNWVKMIF